MVKRWNVMKISHRSLTDKKLKTAHVIPNQAALNQVISNLNTRNKKIEQKQYKKTVKHTQMTKINHFRNTIDSISSYLCTNWFVIEHATSPSSTGTSFIKEDPSMSITQLFRIYDSLPDRIYDIWFEKPEVDDPIYGLDPDCECPHLFVSQTKGGYSPNVHRFMLSLYEMWGYFSEREIRHRCSMFSYMKAQRRCARPQFWEIFDLEDSFLVELQILAVHLWCVDDISIKVESCRVTDFDLL